MNSRKSELTFKHNLQQGRHGWLRLTPAYSIKVVQDILDNDSEAKYVLDPFSGTGTTGLVCTERGLACDLLDINPFLIWFAHVKTATYTPEQLTQTHLALHEITTQINSESPTHLWRPPIADIDRWWSVSRQNLLARINAAINALYPDQIPEKDLLQVAFCRILIEWSNAAFNHQSMSFKTTQTALFEFDPEAALLSQFQQAVEKIIDSARSVLTGQVRVIRADARQVPVTVNGRQYDCVITSPPYPNRMSYIRELRPYMYWLSYLKESREAGELDWQAIGGTWGIATSRVGKWRADDFHVPYDGLQGIIDAVAAKSQTLANYIHKYFVDITTHLNSLYPHLASGGHVHYIVGNSKFYDTVVPVEQIYASILSAAQFTNIDVKCLRKRNSKKELYEFVVSGQKI